MLTLKATLYIEGNHDAFIFSAWRVRKVQLLLSGLAENLFTNDKVKYWLIDTVCCQNVVT
jgi:hypothetical protein